MATNTPHQRPDEMDHATYDAHLIHAWNPKYPWIRTATDDNPSLTPAHFADHATAQLIAGIERSPLREKMRGQVLDETRDVVRYAAFEILHASTQLTHLRQQSPDKAVTMARNDYIDSLKLGTIRTNHRNSPLWEQGTKTQTGGKTMYEIRLKSQWDKKFLEALAGGNTANKFEISDLRSFINEHMPFLATFDRGKSDVYYEGFRTEMLGIADTYSFLDDDLRGRILHRTFDAWLSKDDENRANIAQAERMLKDPFFRAAKKEELSSWTPTRINEAITAYGHRASGNAEKRLEHLLDLQASDPRIKKPDVNLIDQSSLPLIIKHLNGLLASGMEPRQLRPFIKPLLCTLEWHTMDAMERILSSESLQENEREIAKKAAIADAHDIQTVLRQIQEQLRLHPSEHPALGLIAVALASQNRQTTKKPPRSRV